MRILGDALHAEAWSVARLRTTSLVRWKRSLWHGDICEANKAEEDVKVQSFITLPFCLPMSVLVWC